MYIFNDIEVLLFLGDISVFNSNNSDNYITDMVLETSCYDSILKQKINRLIAKGCVKPFILEDDFFSFAHRQQIKFPGLDILSFASIYFAKKNNGFLISRNDMVQKCATENNVDVPNIKDVLINLIKKESYVEMFLNK